jgi:hypothetical protein
MTTMYPSSSPDASPRGGGVVDRAIFDAVSRRYGQFASWAVWDRRHAGRATGDWVSDLRVLDADRHPAVLEMLHTRAVLIALNSGVREEDEGPRAPLSMFHHPVGRDFMLAEAVGDTPFWGAYVTDFFKGVPTKDGTGLAEHLAANPGKVAQDVAALREELAVLAAVRPLLVCLGSQVEPFVRAHFGHDHDVVRVTHYSAAIAKTEYRQQFVDLVPRLPE